MRKNIFIIPSDMLPLPAVLGGAVQNLIEFFLDWNEQHRIYNINVISIYNVQAEKRAEHYKFTTFYYVRIPFDIIKCRECNNRVLRRLGYRITSIVYQYKIKKILSELNYDAIILDNTPQFITLLRHTDSKIIIHIYNDYVNKKTKNLKLLSNKADLIITVSDYISDIVKNTIPDMAVYTVYNGVELSRYQLEDINKIRFCDQCRDKTNINILFVARLVPEKGIRELLLAYEKLRQNKNINLIVIGNRYYSGNTVDSFYNELQTIANRCYNKVSFIGYVPYDELDKYYEQADIGVLPTMWDEPFSMAAIEYMAASLPVIVSNSGGFPEMIGDSGIIINRDDEFINNLANSLQLLIDNKELRYELGKKAYHRSRMFSKENYCEKLNENIQLCLKGNSK